MASPKPKPKLPDNKAQSDKFMETARDVGVDESGRSFVRALQKIVPRKRGRKISR